MFAEWLYNCIKTKAFQTHRSGATVFIDPKDLCFMLLFQWLGRHYNGFRNWRLLNLWTFHIVLHRVFVNKSHDIVRLCPDYSIGLNEALKFYRYPAPKPAALLVKLGGGKYFAKSDLSDIYLQIPVTIGSKDLAINTHKDLFQHNRLHFKVKKALRHYDLFWDSLAIMEPFYRTFIAYVLRVMTWLWV